MDNQLFIAQIMVTIAQGASDKPRHSVIVAHADLKKDLLRIHVYARSFKIP